MRRKLDLEIKLEDKLGNLLCAWMNNILNIQGDRRGRERERDFTGLKLPGPTSRSTSVSRTICSLSQAKYLLTYKLKSATTLSKIFFEQIKLASSAHYSES